MARHTKQVLSYGKAHINLILPEATGVDHDDIEICAIDIYAIANTGSEIVGKVLADENGIIPDLFQEAEETPLAVA